MILKDLMTNMAVKCFKAYDVRGIVPDELNEEIAYLIGSAYAKFLKPRRVIIGRDVRLTSHSLSEALSRGLTDSGVDVYDIGLCGTEEVYFSVFHRFMDGGIMITASHNPAEYNGMKFVREGAKPISGDSGLNTIKNLVCCGNLERSEIKGRVYSLSVKEEYIRHILGYINTDKLRPLKIVVNPGNGCGGPVIAEIETHLPFELIKINNEPDGRFPNGVPNPLLPENRKATIDAINKHNADLGIAWDGDFDRCFFFDEKGNFVEGYYIVGLIASSILSRYPNAKIIHDPRLTWNTIDIVKSHGGLPVMSKTGHAFIKERMRHEDAIYGGEMSGHHYFREFAFCDSGMIPWLLIVELMSITKRTLSSLVRERIRLFPVSGEINRKVQDPPTALKMVEDKFKEKALYIDYTDGLSMEFPEWRFNLRCSNTEPVLRLNVESRGNKRLTEQMREEIIQTIEIAAS